MQMGISDVRVDRILRLSEENYTIFGNGFTQNSSVYVNDTKANTDFLNNTRLDFSDVELRDGDRIKICQVGSKNRVFRSSKTFEYKHGELVERKKKEQKNAEL